MSNIHAGGYVLAEMNACDLPEEVATGLEKTLNSMLGAKYVPVLYVGHQVVAGMNHMIICKQVRATANAEERLVKEVLHSAPTTGEWSVDSVGQIV